MSCSIHYCAFDTSSDLSTYLPYPLEILSLFPYETLYDWIHVQRTCYSALRKTFQSILKSVFDQFHNLKDKISQILFCCS